MFISLGFSCQTRFSIDVYSADPRRNPFDFNITTKGALLAALRTEGRNFILAPDDAAVYKMPTSKREGVHGNGIYFWHDYAIVQNARLDDGWPGALEKTNEKYKYLWERFLKRLRDPLEEKRFIVTNTQANLLEFSSSEADYADKFGLDAAFYNALVGTLDAIGISNYRILFVARRVDEWLALRAGVKDPRFAARFGGAMRLPTHPRVARSVIEPLEARTQRLAHIAGAYTNRCAIQPAERGTSLVTRGGKPWGEVSAELDGYLFVLDGNNRIFTAIADGPRIRFSNRSVWMRSAA